jgi:hypothetical protein
MNDKIVNYVYKSYDDITPLSPAELSYEVNLIGGKLTPAHFPSRVIGKLCDCVDGGDFVLSPINDENVQTGGKRYMQCRKCGVWAHL